MPSFVYIIYSAALDQYYVGHTSDFLDTRIRKHNSNHSGFTGGSSDWVLVYKEEFAEKPKLIGVKGKLNHGKVRHE